MSKKTKTLYYWRGWMSSACHRYATDGSMMFPLAKVTTDAGRKVVQILKKQECGLAEEICHQGCYCGGHVCQPEDPIHGFALRRAAVIWWEQSKEPTIPVVVQEEELKVYFVGKGALRPTELARIHPGYLRLARALFGRRLTFAVNDHVPDKWPIHVMRGGELVAIIAPRAT